MEHEEQVDQPVDSRVAARVRQLTVALFGTMITLAVADIVFQTIQFTIAPGIVGWDEVQKLFDLDREQSLPTWYSIVLLLSTATALGIIAWREFAGGSRFRWHWLGLVPIFLALSIDEQVMGHETATKPVRDLLGLSEDGLLHWAWVVPAVACLVILGLIYLRFLLHLRPGVRELVILAAALYVGGAIGAEMFGGWVIEQRGKETLTYETVTSVEEIMELAGITIFLSVLLREIARRVGRVTVQFSG